MQDNIGSEEKSKCRNYLCFLMKKKQQHEFVLFPGKGFTFLIANHFCMQKPQHSLCSCHYAPNFEQVGTYWFRLVHLYVCVCVCVCVCACVACVHTCKKE